MSSPYPTHIPPHNLAQLIQATFNYIHQPHITINQLIKYIKPPHFPTPPIIQPIQPIKKPYHTPKPNLLLRSPLHQHPLTTAPKQLIVTQVPYQLNKSTLLKTIHQLPPHKNVHAILQLRHQTDTTPLPIPIKLKKHANTQS
ncbi:DNA gyrase subunit A, partial [Staphylococcus epidermidis]|uniref:DNA gyrase subunit A n=1 Tax=Staphylococcus epidermidis TaxID=1282 RepID=UPI0037DA5F33